MPTLVAAGRKASEDGTPVVQRLDLVWLVTHHRGYLGVGRTPPRLSWCCARQRVSARFSACQRLWAGPDSLGHTPPIAASMSCTPARASTPHHAPLSPSSLIPAPWEGPENLTHTLPNECPVAPHRSLYAPLPTVQAGARRVGCEPRRPVPVCGWGDAGSAHHPVQRLGPRRQVAHQRPGQHLAYVQDSVDSRRAVTVGRGSFALFRCLRICTCRGQHLTCSNAKAQKMSGNN